MKKLFIALSIVFVSAIMLPTMVFADENLSDKLTGEGGNVELDEATYIGGCTISEDVTITGKGADKTIITGKITIDADAKVTLDGVTIVSTEDGANVLTVGNGATLKVLNSEIYYKDKSDRDYGNYASFPYGTVGIYVSGGSNVEVVNTEVHAKYGIWIKGSENEVTVSNSKIHGYAAIDLSNSGSPASENKVTINNGSELTGHNIYGLNSENDYGTVVIKDQNGSEVTIDSSKVTNTSDNGNKEDLILYSSDESNTIEVTNTVLDNEVSSSSVFGLDVENIEKLTLTLHGNTVTGNEFPDDDDYIYVTLVIGEEEIVGRFEKDTIEETLPAALKELEAEAKSENIKIDGYYLDADYEDEVDFSEIAGNVKIYVKASEIETETSSEKPPKTGDINLVLIISIVIAAVAGTIFAKKKIAAKAN